ncbi:ABC-2 type transport system ATP-binding protein [Rhodopseudomonas julia]|uniref:ABC-2 type transport system ATP-binding protein n=1 Tax=Rhodopseudomonas julia TaxID=200617 RepID=A0ABU0CAN6_9BRAD|nr:ATP-binding cassette domain-containing protein [Rhodopseudomonas julia]MDQ0327596.1 ABC-2 type transport system ATP-binding protein [Rhodopseudomonas julia]
MVVLRAVSAQSDLLGEAPAQSERQALLIENLSFSYRDKPVLDDVGFAVEKGRFTALLGPNGAGKTTLFSLITRLLETSLGRILIAGRDTREAGAAALASLGIVFQQPTLDLDLTVRQNLAYFARLRGLSLKEAGRRIDRELTRFDMAERARETVRSLNGGHRRRVEIARALLHDPDLLLLDEPTVGLDAPSRKAIVSHVHALAGERDVGILWATHLIDEIREEDALVILHEGRVVARGISADIVARSGPGSLDTTFTMLTTPTRESSAGERA